MCRTIIVGLNEYIDIRNSTIVRCHSNTVLARSNAVNHIHPTLWSTMCLTIKCDKQAFKIYSFIFWLVQMMKSKGLHLNLEDQKGKSISTDSSEIGSIYRNIEFLNSIEMSSVLRKPAYS